MRLREYFLRHPDGSWEPRLPVTITGANGSQIVVNPGVRFTRGVLFNGYDIATLCDQDAYL